MADSLEHPKDQPLDTPQAAADGARVGPEQVGQTYLPGTAKVFQSKPTDLVAFGFQNPPINGTGDAPAQAHGASANPSDKVLGKVHSPASAAEIKQFAATHEVSVTQKDGQYQFSLKADGKIQYIGAADSLAGGEKLLHDRMIAKENELHKTYGADFSAEKDPPGKQLASGRDTNAPLRYRDPTLAELAAVQSSLERIRPTRDNKEGELGPKFSFLKDAYDRDIPKAARFVLGHDGRAQVYFDPGWNKDRPPTELDLSSRNQQSMQRAIDHELGHNSLATMHGARNDPKDARDNGKAIDKIYSDLGWKVVGGRYMIEGRDNSFYTPEGTDQQRYFVRHDASGRPADGQGRATTEQNAERIQTLQMRIRSKVEQISEYFPGPDEMYAEGYSAFTSGDKSRQDLKYLAPKLYDVVKEADQNQLNQKYPPFDGHTPRVIRALDGKIVPNTQANATKISDFEKRPNKSGEIPFNTLPIQ